MFLIPELEKFAQKKQASWLGQKKSIFQEMPIKLYMLSK